MGATTIQRVLDERHLTIEEIEESMAVLESLGLGHLIGAVPDAGKQVTNNEANANSSE